MKNITNIQKFSIHDGDGIRTTVFFKGCPLKCEWCHNPETQKFEKEMQVDREKCTGCGACAAVCPNGAIHMEEGRPILDAEACVFCGKCTRFCPTGARLSGGEVMSMDMDYLLAVAKELKRQDVTLTIDTCGFVPYEKFQELLPYVNTFLYDVKVMDPELHKKYMGTDNALILENLVRLAKDGARIYIRIPTVKEVNGNEENMKETIAFLQEHDIHPAQINLLPYHDTGSGKYRKLDMEYKGTDLHAPDKEEMEALAALFINAGYKNTKIGG